MEVKQKSIKFNFIMNVVLTISSVVFPLITFPYITRILLPEGTGKIAFANSIVTYFTLFSMLGIPTYGIRACAKVRDNKEQLTRIVQEIWIINVVMTLIISILYACMILIIPALRVELPLMFVCGLSIVLNMLGMEWLYKGLECYTFITVRSILFKTTGIILMFLLVHTKADYVRYALISVFANAGYGVLNFIMARNYIFKYKIKNHDFRRHIKPILNFFAMSVAVVIYTNLDIVMLGALKSSQEVGYYDVAVKVKVILVNIVTALGTVILPRASYYVETNRLKEFHSVIRKSFQLIAVLSIPLTIYFSVMAKESVLLLSGSQYLPAVFPMMVIMPTIIIIGFSNLTGIQILIPMGKEIIVTYSEVAGAILNLTINLMLIPRLGVMGAAIGTLAAELLVLLVQTIFIKKEKLILSNTREFLKIIIAILVSLPILLLIRKTMVGPTLFHLLVTAVCFFGVYIILLSCMREQTARLFYEIIGEKLKRRK